MHAANIMWRVASQKKRRFLRSRPIFSADFGFVRYSLDIGVHQRHYRRYSYGCYNEFVVFNKIVNGKAQRLMEFHSYHLAMYFSKVLERGAANYPLHLLRGVSLHTQAQAKDVYTLSLISSDYTNEKFVDLENIHRIKVEILPIPEGFSGAGKDVILAGFHRDYDYFVGPAVVIPINYGEHQDALQKGLARFLAEAASGLAKAACLAEDAAVFKRLGNYRPLGGPPFPGGSSPGPP